MTHNVVLTGFMGTGKTTIGRELARRLDRPFVDMDVLIEERTGKPIPRLFAEDGEGAFRQLEANLCRELSDRQGLVIATGGGTLVDPANRRRMEHSGILICLTCPPEVIQQRIDNGGTDRPLLDVAHRQEEIERLLEARRQAYEAIPWQVDTSALSIPETVTQVAKLASTITLPVTHPGGTYPIHVGDGLLARAGQALRAAGAPRGTPVAIVSNPVVAPLYGGRVKSALRTAGFRPIPCSIPDGEKHKSLETVATLYDQFLEGDLDRSGTVLALGGGVTGDVAGFAAATFMRGVRFAQVPTTLLAMVDASVGGKTGVDLSRGKNLVGAFKQPAVVVVDPTVLTTLPIEDFRSGMAEMIKHGILAAPALFAGLEMPSASLPPMVSTTQIARALQVKIDVVEADPFEQGERVTLNLGHTVAHGLELLSRFSLRHGEAVSIGLVAAASIAVRLGLAEPAVAQRIARVLSAWSLPVRCPPYEAGAIWQALAHDKKKRGQVQRWVLPRRIGAVEIVEDVDREVVEEVLRGMGAQ